MRLADATCSSPYTVLVGCSRPLGMFRVVGANLLWVSRIRLFCFMIRSPLGSVESKLGYEVVWCMFG